MDKKIADKIQVLTQQAKENNEKPKDKKEIPVSNIPNSLADHIKTKEQAHSFMILLNSL